MKPNFDFEYTKDLILAKFPLLGVHLAGIKFKEMSSCPTMATDGYLIYYSSKFLNSISEEEKCFCLTHEAMHIAFDHIVRLENKNPFVWNIATDAVINQMLQAEGWKIPEWAVNIPEAKDKSAVEMYHILKEKYDQEQEKFKELQDQYNKNNQDMQNEQPKNGKPSQSQPTDGSQNNDQNQQNDNGQAQDQNQQGAQQQNSNEQGDDQNSQTQGNESLNQPNNHNQDQEETQNQQNEQGDKESLKQQISPSNQNHQCSEPNGQMDSQNPNNSQNNSSASQNGEGDQKEMPQNQQNQKHADNSEKNESKIEKPSSYFDQFEGKNTHDHWEKSLKKHIEEKEKKENESDKKEEKSAHEKGNTQETSLSKPNKKGDSSNVDNEEEKNTSLKNEKQAEEKNSSQHSDQKEESSQNESQLNNNPNQEVGSASEGADERCSENEKNFLNQNKNMREERAQEIINRLNERKTAYQKKHLAAQETRYEIGEGEEVCSWKKILKKALLDEETRWSYRRSNRGNDYMARAEELEDETKSETEVLMDVSGSVTEPMLRGFLHQLRPLLKHTTFKVGCFDSEFYGFTEIKKSSDIDSFRIVSSKDWENFDNAVRQFSKKTEVNKIIFTDGGNPPGYMPQQDLKKMNVIWIVFYNREFKPCCGKVIHVELNELLKKRINFQNMKRNSSRQRD